MKIVYKLNDSLYCWDFDHGALDVSHLPLADLWAITELDYGRIQCEQYFKSDDSIEGY